ncbi:MAG: hypothetical protein ACK52J_00590 [bacterium]|jgi:hypothetical protein
MVSPLGPYGFFPIYAFSGGFDELISPGIGSLEHGEIHYLKIKINFKIYL